jgi:hypothetical protein
MDDNCLLRTLTADIDPSAKILAMALYAHAPTAGDLPLTQVLAIVGLRTTGALRHLRSQLATAAIVATTVTDGTLSWRFLSASQPRAARPTDAQADPERVPQTRTTAASASQPRAARPTDAQADPERVPQTRTTAASASQPRAARPTDAQADPVTPVTPPPARPTDAPPPPQTPPGRQVGSLINLNQDQNLPTPLPPTAEEQARSIRLLRAISVNIKLAAQIAARWNFREVCAFVAVYLADHAAGKCNGAGVLKTRCLDPDSAAPQLAADAPELAVAPLSQHITPADRIAWQQAELVARYHNPAVAADDFPPPAPRSAAEIDAERIWTAITDSLRPQLPKSTYDTWLRDVSPLTWGDGTLRVCTATAAASDWLDKRLRVRLERALAAASGETSPITLIIET